MSVKGIKLVYTVMQHIRVLEKWDKKPPLRLALRASPTTGSKLANVLYFLTRRRENSLKTYH
jgi:hypothetical protein